MRSKLLRNASHCSSQSWTLSKFILSKFKKLLKKYFSRSEVVEEGRDILHSIKGDAFSPLTGGLKTWCCCSRRNLLEIWTCLCSCCSCLETVVRPIPLQRNCLNTERSYITRLRCSACQSQSQRTANAPIASDWLIHSSLILASCHRILFFLPVFCGWEINLKTKIRKKYKQAAKVIYCIYGKVLFPISLLWICNSLKNYSVLFNLHFVCTIITLIILITFKYPTKIRLCSPHANQNHLLRDFVSFSACWETDSSRQASALLF